MADELEQARLITQQRERLERQARELAAAKALLRAFRAYMDVVESDA